ncbi:RRQRL motif-containing zinc-binding protein [Sphaerisporangium rubeum]|uniref:Ribosomal protein S14 n=1 Tax=Sphaerisporangium rubeum TaxID=321317 RepID=A0A7X0M7Q2_9ACTN|nr:RRQRL motif-containing zinc-binding protein [Sphaerisporangium rubeum]MBB6473269.1 ribosomal protein S14 [Sphaerisporangium rubeum]
MSRIRARFWDPAGEKYGLPTYPWQMAPAHLLTLRQLTARGLRPGGQGVQAQILWRSRRHGAPGVRAAYLYDVRFALPKRTASPAQLEALGKANAARRRCTECGTDAGYVIPRRYGMCLDCALGPEQVGTEVAA